MIVLFQTRSLAGEQEAAYSCPFGQSWVRSLEE
jgi:hypothetical protein